MPQEHQHLQEITWKEARDSICVVNPELGKLINEWQPGDEYKLYRARYRYGDYLLHNGKFQLPNSNGTPHPLNNHQIPSTIQRALSYSNVPLGINTVGGNEVALELENRIMPLAFFRPGTLLGLWETLEPRDSYFPRRIWNMMAGGTFIMLPKISVNRQYLRLKKQYGLHAPIPKYPFDHKKVFIELSRHKAFKPKWYNEIIFFSDKWLEPQEDNIHWIKFHRYLLQSAWNLSSYNRNQVTFDRVWELFTKRLENQYFRPHSHLMDTMKHLITIDNGIVPGFRAATDEELAGPHKRIQEIFLNDYGLQKYIPTMLEPHHFSLRDNAPVYFSMQFSTVFESLPKNRHEMNVMAELKELKFLMDSFFEEAMAGHLKIEGTAIERLIKNVQFDYFHSSIDQEGEIKLTKSLPREDKSLLYCPVKTKNNEFAASSSFLRGCVRVSKKKD